MESFKDTRVFIQLNNPSSVVNKIVLSPFFTKFTLTHYSAIKDEKVQSRSATPERLLPGQLTPGRKKAPAINVDPLTGGTTSNDISVAQSSMVMEEEVAVGISIDALLLAGIL